MICRNQQWLLRHCLRDVITPCQSVLRTANREVQRRRGGPVAEVQRKRDGTPVAIDVLSALSSLISGTTPSDAPKTVEYNLLSVRTMPPLGLPRASTAISEDHFSLGRSCSRALQALNEQRMDLRKNSFCPARTMVFTSPRYQCSPSYSMLIPGFLQHVHQSPYVRG